MAALLRGISTLPFTALKLTLRLMRRIQRGPTPRCLLPVAGLDHERAATVLVALRAEAREAQEDDAAVVDQWLAAVQLAQVGLDRLVGALQCIEGDLTFWRDRLEGSSRHGLFLLLGQGPSKFAGDVYALVRHVERRLRHQEAVHRRGLTATEKIEQRVAILRALQGRLAESLATVNNAAGGLYLKPPRADGHEAPEPAAGLLTLARRDVRVTLAATSEAFERLAPVQRSLDTRPEALALSLGPGAALTGAGASGAADGAKEPEGGSAASTPPASAGDAGGNGAGDDAGDAGADLAAALQRAQAALGVTARVDPGMTVTEVLRYANRAAHRQPSVLELPAWVRAPSRYQQYWTRYTVYGAVVAYGALFLYRHSRLSGSRDLERWAGQAATGLRSTYRENVLGPLAQLRDELFKTFRQRRSIVSVAEYENDRDSLKRMLSDFETDYLAKHKGRSPAVEAGHPEASGLNAGDGKNETAAVAAASDSEMMPGMAFMMEAYEQELKKPIRNVVNGQLPRTLLIQVQKLKLDTESAMLEMDQLLKANELNLALIAAVPAFLAAGGGLFLLVRWLKPAPVDARYEALPCRMAMVALERALQAADAEGSQSSLGLAVYDLAKVYREACTLYRRHEGSDSAEEWPNLRRDLTDLAGPLPLRQKMRITKRVSRVYTIFAY